jgi:hypothetical protein
VTVQSGKKISTHFENFPLSNFLRQDGTADKFIKKTSVKRKRKDRE